MEHFKCKVCHGKGVNPRNRFKQRCKPCNGRGKLPQTDFALGTANFAQIGNLKAIPKYIPSIEGPVLVDVDYIVTYLGTEEDDGIPFETHDRHEIVHYLGYPIVREMENTADIDFVQIEDLMWAKG